MIHFTKEKYSNGLTLIHHLDETTPFVVINVLYKVGARNEFKDKTGFAHLFEHLMFEGTVNQPSYDHPIQQAGGTNNAFTNNDFTNYYIKLPKENLELAVCWRQIECNF
ncbi:MAG: insulinase family protein [Chitinophagales bacterium]